MQERNTRITRQSEHLNNSILMDEASTPDTHNSQNKKKGIRESRLPFGSAGSLVSWRHVSPRHTRTRSQPVLDAAGSPSVLSSLATRSASAHTFTRLRSQAGVTQSSTDESVLKHEQAHATLSAARPLSSAYRPPLSFATPCPRAPPPFWACSTSLRHRGIFFRRNPKQWEAFFLFFLPRRLLAGNSRRSRTTALFAREFRAGNLAASPSIPRGMSPHGARLMWVPFDGW